MGEPLWVRGSEVTALTAVGKMTPGEVYARVQFLLRFQSVATNQSGTFGFVADADDAEALAKELLEAAKAARIAAREQRAQQS